MMIYYIFTGASQILSTHKTPPIFEEERGKGQLYGVSWVVFFPFKFPTTPTPNYFKISANMTFCTLAIFACGYCVLYSPNTAKHGQ